MENIYLTASMNTLAVMFDFHGKSRQQTLNGYGKGLDESGNVVSARYGKIYCDFMQFNLLLQFHAQRPEH
jgi:hypothetical protein